MAFKLSYIIVYKLTIKSNIKNIPSISNKEKISFIKLKSKMSKTKISFNN